MMSERKVISLLFAFMSCLGAFYSILTISNDTNRLFILYNYQLPLNEQEVFIVTVLIISLIVLFGLIMTFLDDPKVVIH
ncbi:hypothetical protein [Butyrivibrio sp. MC2013]|uniref:hypothetical protein n=1 Tax=Butyrivibrio sp. MC2013 TaxID=1280686 RepID=UPI00047E3E4E|nr:hypothetical protein [Butyrivibrio sp. MC2013]